MLPALRDPRQLHGPMTVLHQNLTVRTSCLVQKVVKNPYFIFKKHQTACRGFLPRTFSHWDTQIWIMQNISETFFNYSLEQYDFLYQRMSSIKQWMNTTSYFYSSFELLKKLRHVIAEKQREMSKEVVLCFSKRFYCFFYCFFLVIFKSHSTVSVTEHRKRKCAE